MPNRSVTTITNPDPTRRMPNPPAYSTGSTRTIAATPNHANSRFVSSIETRKATAVTPAPNRPKKPASRSASGKWSLAARA